jgi:hypothetical protein
VGLEEGDFLEQTLRKLRENEELDILAQTLRKVREEEEGDLLAQRCERRERWRREIS